MKVTIILDLPDTPETRQLPAVLQLSPHWSAGILPLLDAAYADPQQLADEIYQEIGVQFPLSFPEDQIP